MREHTFAQSWQDRDLQYAVFSSEQNIRKREALKKKLSQLGDGASINPETLNDLPSVGWLSFGVHGDEVRPLYSALFLEYKENKRYSLLSVAAVFVTRLVD